MPRASLPKYTVIRDTREKAGQGWSFAPSANCEGTECRALKTGDYTILGYEDDFIIDRKGSISEFAGNIYQARFLAELERMRTFRVAIVLLEFTLDDVMAWPASSGIPRARWSSLRLTGFAFLKRINELELAFPGVRFVFAGGSGKSYAASLFKRLTERPEGPPV